jgi:hypothetical protein
MQFGRPYCVAARTQIYALPHHKFLNNIREDWSKKDGFCIKNTFLIRWLELLTTAVPFEKAARMAAG